MWITTIENDIPLPSITTTPTTPTTTPTTVASSSSKVNINNKLVLYGSVDITTGSNTTMRWAVHPPLRDGVVVSSVGGLDSQFISASSSGSNEIRQRVRQKQSIR